MSTECLNCGHVQELLSERVYTDENGPFTVCEDCGGSYDIPEEYCK
jgi:transcription elongation factor Elf1